MKPKGTKPKEINMDFDFECKKCNLGWFSKNYKSMEYNRGLRCPNCNYNQKIKVHQYKEK